MHVKLMATWFLVAGLLTACGFTPPAPPKPANGPRIPINREDPRLEAKSRMQESVPPVETARLEPPAKSPTPPAADAPPSAVSIPVPEAPPSATAAPATPLAAAAQDPTSDVKSESVGTQPATHAIPQVDTKTSSNGGMEPAAAPAPGQEPTLAPPAPIVVKEVWRITPEDGTVRQALARWATKAGWTFGPEQWEVNFDLPIQAPAEFEAESFQEAAQALSQAIAMTESPVRPCFYGNRVLRVVPFNRSCNRSPATP